MTAEPTAGLGQALDATGRLIAAVRAEQWADPTPCSDWSVRDLVSHLVRGNRAFATIVQGGPPEASGGSPPAGPGQPGRERPDTGRPDTGRPDAELPDAYRAAADAVLAAFSRPGVLDEVFTVPFGTVPGRVALHLRITEALVHGWDLARATGQPAHLPEALAEQELAFSRRALGEIPAGRRPFGPPQPVAADASAMDQLAACLGRSVATPGMPAPS